MSRGHDGRGKEQNGSRDNRNSVERGAKSSRTPVRMTAERARAIQSHADRTESNQDFKIRAMAAAERNSRTTQLDESSDHE